MDTKSNKRSKSKVSKLIGIISSIVLFSIGTYFMYGTVLEIFHARSIEKELDAAQIQYEETLNKQKELSSTKEKLQDEDYVQNYARGTHLVSNEDEQVFILIPEE